MEALRARTSSTDETPAPIHGDLAFKGRRRFHYQGDRVPFHLRVDPSFARGGGVQSGYN